MAINRKAEEAAYLRFVGAGMTPAGACGLIGNLEAESDGFYPNRLEYLCVKRLKENGKTYTDETYTAAVDSGKISCEEFLHPLPGKQYGYGLAQWTTPARKSGLWNLAKQRGVSIADMDTQLDYLLRELQESFPSVLKVLKTAKTIREASDIVLVKFEAPAGITEATKASRASRGELFKKYFDEKGEKHMISNCGHDENGKYTGGKAGDQTGGEWAIIPWYDRKWNYILRHPDAKVREEIALLAERAARNNLVGYDQGQRHTYWEHLKASDYDPAQITIACEADCSSGVLANCKAAGYRLRNQKLVDINQYGYTGNMRAILKAAGFEVLTASKYLTSPDYLIRGDILLYEGHHTATNLTNGSKATSSNTVTTKSGGACEVKLKSFVKGNEDNQIKTIQRILKSLGYKGKDGKQLTIDGSLGDNTEYAITRFQKDKKLQINTYGTVAAKTWTALLNCN